VDKTEPRPDGQEDQALPVRPDGRRMGAASAADAEAWAARSLTRGGFPRGHQRRAQSGALGLRLADATGRLRVLADRLQLVPRIAAAVFISDDPRCGTDGRPGAGRRS